MAYYLAATELIFPAGVTVGASTLPYNLGQVSSVIFEIEGEVDGFAAAAGYTVPISASGATYAFGAVRGAVKNGVLAQLLSTLFPNMGGTSDRTSTAAMCRQAYSDFKKGLKDGSLSLVDASKSTGEGGRALPRAAGVASPALSLGDTF